VTGAFFTELPDLRDRRSTFADALVLAGDVNIRLERATDPATVEFLELIAGYGLCQQVSCVTHDAGGTLDVVYTRSDLPAPTVDAVVSACRITLWTTSLLRPPAVYATSTRRARRSFNLDEFQGDLQAPALCDDQKYQELDAR